MHAKALCIVDYDSICGVIVNFKIKYVFSLVFITSVLLQHITTYFKNLFSLSVFDAKHLIGRDFSDRTVQQDMKHWPFDIQNQA